jgi:hypothetical protein
MEVLQIDLKLFERKDNKIININKPYYCNYIIFILSNLFYYLIVIILRYIVYLLGNGNLRERKW